MENIFLKDFISGIDKENKTLSSKYFYDDIGSKIFQEIMKLVRDKNDNDNLLYRAFYCIVKISTFTDNLHFEFGKMFPEFEGYSRLDALKESVRLIFILGPAFPYFCGFPILS